MSERIAKLEAELLAEREKKLSNLKCPTCGYQLVALDNDELAKLTEKAAYHELRQQLATLVDALKEAREVIAEAHKAALAAEREAIVELRNAGNGLFAANQTLVDALKEIAENETGSYLACNTAKAALEKVGK